MALTAILFPGQGSQSRDMRESVAQVRPDLLPILAGLVGEDPFRRAQGGTGSSQSPMMEPAVPEFVAALEQVEIREPRVPVLSAVTAQPFDDVRRRLAEGLLSPVRWRETMLELHRLGAERFVEVGPGRVLTGLAKRTLSDVELVNA